MANLSKMKARAMWKRFEGRITDTHAAHCEFTGNPPVLIPETGADVGRALTLARAAGRTVYVRSGDSVTPGDLVADPNAAVVSLEALTDIDVDLQRISVGPAATVGDVATKLRHRALFLPLPDQPTMSIAAAVLGNQRAPFPRSVGDHPLSDGVVEADVVMPDPAQMGVTTRLDADGWRAFRKDGKGVVIRLVLDASRWARFGKNRWLRAWMVPYAKETFGPLCDRLFGRSTPAGVDLSLRASTGAYGARLVVVRATGQDRERGERARSFVETALDAAKCTVLWSERVDNAGAALAAWVGTGPGCAREGEVDGHLTADAAWSSDDEAAFLDEADRLVNAGAWVELRKGSLLRQAFVPAAAGGVPTAVLAPPPARPKAILPPAAVTVAALDPTHVTGPIPGFHGEVFERSDDDRAYRDAIRQYAVSSLDAATVARRMTPLLVANARDAADVVSAVIWAASQNHKVVARSGGHQYCGLSSGGKDTVVIDVGLLHGIDFSPDGTRVTVGPGVQLQDLTKALRDRGVAFPHGECPLVNVGGHVQTGGVGHQLRSLGVALDWVREFKMVAWDENGALGEHVYPLPTPGSPRATDDVFAAVLGGGPGSWGVLTAITFAVAQDADPQYVGSQGFTRTFPYNRSGWAAAFTQLRLWSEREHAGALPAGVDLFLSVISSDAELLPNANLRPSVLLVEATALAAAGAPEIKQAVDAIEAEVSWLDRIGARVVDLASGSPNGPTPLSLIVHHGVRTTSALGGMPGGREFGLPYKKSLYVTRDPLPAAFCDHFVDLVDRVNRHPDVKVVFQGVVGGGRFQENGAHDTTRMQHRDALLQLVFDVFYRDGHAQTAEDFQEEMGKLWKQFLPGESRRMFWGTYEDPNTNGAQIDMSNPDTQARYYDSAAVYAKLRQVKAVTDPHDVFHTAFTVELP